MNCKACKNPISNDSIFCEWCGLNQKDIQKSYKEPNKNSKNKALKYTVYLVLIVLSIVSSISKDDVPTFWIILGVIITIEFYVYSKNRFENK